MSTVAIDAQDFDNPGRRLLRFGLIGGGACVAYAAIGAAILFVSQAPTNDGAGLFWAVSSIFAVSIGVAMFFVALVAVFVARAGDRAIAQFRSGHVLADWRFPADEWEAFLAVVQVRRRKLRLQLGLFGVVLPLGIFGLIVGSVVAHGVAAAIACVAGTVAGVALALGLAKLVAGWADRRYLARMRHNRRVLIARGAICCGGALTLWDVSMTVLQRIRIIPGSPLQLEVTIGPGGALQAVDTVAGVAAIASGGAGGGAAAGVTQVMVPVPVGREADAAAVVNTLQGRAAVAPLAAAAAVVPAVADRVPDRPPPARPAARLPMRGVSWWAIAAGLWVVGLVLFLAAPEAPGGSGQDFTRLGTAMSVAGLFLWIGSLIAAVAAGLRTLRSVRHRRHIAQTR